MVYSLDGHRIYNYNNLTFFLGRAGDTLDFVVLRDGEKVRLDGVEMPLQARTDEEGKTTYLRGISVGREIIPATLGSKLLYSWYNSLDFVRTVWISLGDLVSGVVGLRDLSGPVGIVKMCIRDRDEIKKQVKKSEITEDDQKQLEKELQDLTDKRCKEVDELTAKKEQELMAV